MKNMYFIILISSLTLNACLPAFLQPLSNPTSEVDTQGTISAGLTSGAQTLQQQATPTILPSATRTLTPTQTMTETPISGTPSETAFATYTTGTVVIPTDVTGTPGTPFLPIPDAGSSTPTLFPRFYGTQPPAVPFGSLKLINKSKSEVYISLQCVTADGQVSILEYPVPRRVSVHAPAGKYIYVAWVGGRKMTGQFSLGKSTEKIITIYKDRIAIK